MTEQIRISAKSLGRLALPHSCPRCFWIRLRVQDKLPYQIFPGIFSSIDSYGKRLVHAWFDRHGGPPPWLVELGEIKGYLAPPHFSRFQLVDPDTGVLLTGTPDGVLVRADDSCLIVDYKTAKFTAHQDALFPMYEAQLNAYAYLGERCGLSPVSGLALVYTEPVTEQAVVEEDATVTAGGFVMPFSAHILPVQLRPDLIPSLLRKAREISAWSHAPEALPRCEDCPLLDRLLAVAGG
jgi:hypothetical protein